LQSPDGRVEKSLGTPDRRQAEVLALPLIAEHKAKLLAARPRLAPIWEREYAPGLHVLADGGKVFATERELHHLDAKGRTTSTTPNVGPAWQIVGLEKRLGLPMPVVVGSNPDAAERPKLATKNGDDAILETYLKHANVTGFYEREARSTWALYKTLTDGKPLKDANRDDGRKLVQHFEDQGNKSRTIRKKIMWLNAAVNLAISEGRLKFNPFAGVVPDREDKIERLPLDASDIRDVKRNLCKLSKTDQLLFRLLAASGMRLAEAFEIGSQVKIKIDGEWQERTNSEMKERGVRYIIVGHKTKQSKRRIPLPAAALPYLPKSITGPLFKGGAKAASKRLNRFLNDCGIVDPRKVIHSLRHRAQDRLRAAGCQEDVRWAILGHEKETVAAGYGAGFPVPLLKHWIDKIAF
jgi:integrase